jgi:7-cyano-7-deazaguanine synthase
MLTSKVAVFSDNEPAFAESSSLAVLYSGGLDSAILLAESLRAYERVQPLYVRSGHYWEMVELEHAKHFLSSRHSSILQPLQVLEVPVADLYAGHWSITGHDVPDLHSADEAVFLPGRNVLLLGKAMIWCHLHGVNALALAALGSNPFPDATPAFFTAFQDIVNRAIDGNVKVLLPFANLTKTDVMIRGRDLPLELTFSCIRPVGELHCGRCNKCAERRRAFADAGMIDKTVYEV